MEISWTEKLWIIPANRTDKRADLLPLSDLAIQLLEAAFKLSKSELAFPDETGKKASHPAITSRRWTRTRARLFEAKQIPDLSVQLYDARRFFRVVVRHRLKFSREVAERLLGHAQPADISSVYDCYDYLPDCRRAMEGWAVELKRIISAETSPSDENAEALSAVTE